MRLKELIKLELPPIGIKLLDEKTVEDFKNITLFSGVSYCQAVFGATFGMELILKPGSVNVCKWVPVVLGFKHAANDFEKSIHPHFKPLTSGIYIAPLHLFRENTRPDGVIIRTTPDNYRKIINILTWESFIDPLPYKQDVTALNEFKASPPKGFSAFCIKYISMALSALNSFTLWHRFTAVLFKSDFVTKIFDKFITRYMANMSMCRNSFVIPYLTGKANISYFCTGGIAWGKNDSGNMTSGFPMDIFNKLEPHLDYPGKIEGDPRLDDLEKIKKRLLETAKAKGCTLAPVDGKGA